MPGENIFIVEDERIVAEDLKRMLERLGYKVVGSASSGDEAIEKMKATPPHLVLMDIRIQGALDGIDVAEHVVTEFDIPVIYLTAYADETTVDRAKGTLPSGYILKPFEERSLKTIVELALYKHNMDRMFIEAQDWHGGILANLSMAVMAIDGKSNITYMNKTAENLTGHQLDKVLGKSVDDVLITENTRFFINRNGQRISVDCKKSVIKDPEGNHTGTALILKEVNS
jgi:CheY-like chemotaxis protein